MLDSGTSPFAEYDPVSPPPPAPLRYELRPLSLGEILDRTFAVYRQKFWLYAGLSSLSALVPVLSTLVQYIFVLPAMTTTAKANPQMVARQSLMLVTTAMVAILVAMLVYGITQAATAIAFSNDYLGEFLGQPASIKGSFKVALKHWFRYILILLWQGFSAVWLPVLLLGLGFASLEIPAMLGAPTLFPTGVRVLGGLLMLLTLPASVYAVIAFIRNSIAVMASVNEDLPVIKAMKRSKFLVAGHKGRVFGIMLTAWVVQLVAAVLQGLTGFAVGISHGPVRLLFEAITLLVTFCTAGVVIPVLSIALCLLYVDERVRKEGFDVEILMLRGGTPPPPPPTPDSLASPFTSELV